MRAKRVLNIDNWNYVCVGMGFGVCPEKTPNLFMTRLVPHVDRNDERVHIYEWTGIIRDPSVYV